MVLLVHSVTATSYYDYAVVGTSGQNGFAGFGDRPSINAYGAVAFVGQTANGEALYLVDSPGQAPRQVGVQSGASFGRAVHLNDACDVLARDSVTFTSALKDWACDGSGLRQVIARGAYPSSYPYSVVNAYATLNNSRQIVFTARPYAQNPTTTLLITTSVLATNSLTFSGNLVLYPMISESGHVVLRNGNLTTDPIRLFSFNLQSSDLVSAGFSSVGRSPGIGEDDSAVGFCGDRGSGQGIFLSFKNQGGGRSVFRVVGENAGLGGPNPELGTNSSGAPIYFSSFDTDSRVGVVQFSSKAGSLTSATFLVSFVGTPNAPSGPGSSSSFTHTKGLWVARVDCDAAAAPRVLEIRPAIQVGDPVGASTLLDLGVFDPIAKVAAGPATYCDNARWDHRLVFYASTSSGAAIVRAESIEGKVYFRQAAKEALLYGPDDDINQPLGVKPDPALLQNQLPLGKGLVADGVTPLLMQFRLLHPPSTPTAYTISLQTEGGSISNLSDHLWVLNGSDFVKSDHLVLSAAYPTGFCYLSGIKSDELVVDPNTVSASVAVTVESAPGTACPQSFQVARPPIVLVHGYYSDQNTWSPGFYDVLAAARPSGFVQKVEYGVRIKPDGSRDSTENTFGALSNLAWELHNSLLPLETPSATLRADWAFTRYDLVAHSQGGVLARFLSMRPGPSWQAARSPDNCYRGRFHRVITLNSPHNGSVIPYYLKERPAYPLAPLMYLLKAPPLSKLLQPKFNPYGDQMKGANNLALDSAIPFHALKTTLEGVDPPSSINCFRNPYFMYGPELCIPGVGSTLLPHGSDGIVDYDSMGGGPGTKTSALVGVEISHCPPELVFGVLPDNTATRSQAVASRVVGLLDGGDAEFGPFVNPFFDSVRKLQIDTLLLTFKIVKALPDIIKKLAIPGAKALSCFDFGVEPRPAEPITSPVQWVCSVYGPNGVTSDGTSIIAVTNDPTRVRVCVDNAVLGTVVLQAAYLTTNSTVVYAMPAVVLDRPVGTNMVGIMIDPSEVTLSPGDSVQPVLWGVFDNGQTSETLLASRSTLGADIFGHSSCFSQHQRQREPSGPRVCHDHRSLCRLYEPNGRYRGGISHGAPVEHL